MAPDHNEKQAAAQAAVDILHEMAAILNCELDRRTLSICISMIENGVNPMALAKAIVKLREAGQQVEEYIASQAQQ